VSSSRRCAGNKINGERCRRTTSRADGWCGQCDEPLDRVATTPADRFYSDAAALRAWGPGGDPFESGWDLNETEDRSSSDEVRDRLEAAGSHDTPDYILARLAADPAPEVRAAAAANPYTPAGSVVDLASDPAAEPAAGVAQNPAATPEALAALAGRADDENLTAGESWMIRSAQAAAARHPRVTPEILDTLSRNPDPRVSEATAGSPKTTPGTLSRLAVHPNPDVRAAAATNPNCPLPARAASGLLHD